MTQHNQWQEAPSQTARTNRHNDGQSREGFRLLGKADVQAIFGISIRCLEKWIKQGLVPPPTCVGGRRYWHPDTFYAELTRLVPPQGAVKVATPAGSRAAHRAEHPEVVDEQADCTSSSEDEREPELDQLLDSRKAIRPRKGKNGPKGRAPTSTKLAEIKRNLNLLD